MLIYHDLPTWRFPCQWFSIHVYWRASGDHLWTVVVKIAMISALVNWRRSHPPFLCMSGNPMQPVSKWRRKPINACCFFLSVHTRKSGVVDRQKTARDIWIQVVCFSHTHLQVSWNGGTPKWMVYNGKSHENGWFGGTPILGNIHFNNFQQEEPVFFCAGWSVDTILSLWYYDYVLSSLISQIPRYLHLYCQESSSSLLLGWCWGASRWVFGAPQEGRNVGF